jgi:GAF domain-containing protein
MREETAIVDEIRAALQGSDARTAKLHRVAEILRMGAGYRWVGIFEIAGEGLALAGWSGPGIPTTSRLPAGRGLCGDAVARRRTVVVADVAKDKRYLETFADTRSEIVVPIVNTSTGGSLGVIDVESERVGAFGDVDRRLIEHAAGEIAAAFSPSPG